MFLWVFVIEVEDESYIEGDRIMGNSGMAMHARASREWGTNN